MSTASTGASGNKRRNILVLLPLIVFLALAALFLVRLWSGDPSRLPSALIGRPAPPTDLPPLAGLERDGKAVPGLSNAAFPGELTLVNVWASWCIPCADEVPYLERLSKDKRVKLVGINYKDAPDNARRFLNRYGNPFVAAGADANGRTAIDWGVYGVPETFLVGHDGKQLPGLSNATFAGKVTLVNVWASWCVPCADEVPFLDQLSKDNRIQLVGINYKDAADNARRFLNRYGNPFVAAGADANGRTSIDWGVYGVPETYLIGRDGRIAYKLVGPVTAENLTQALEPEIVKALKP